MSGFVRRIKFERLAIALACCVVAGSLPTLAVPQQPTGLFATAVSSSQINLQWTDVSNEKTYTIERALSPSGSWAQVGSTAQNVVTFANPGLSGSTTYYYRVIARDQNNSPSPASATASATTFLGPPAAPTNLSASAVSSSQISIFWNDNSSDEASFAIETAPSGSGPWSPLTTVSTDTTFYYPSGLSGGTTYYYRVRATNTAGTSAWSNTAWATTPIQPPAAPTSLTATAASSSQINLSWNDNATNETGYRVERWTGSSWLLIATLGANSSTYASTGLNASTSYTYHVQAYNSAGNSAFSNSASAATLSPPPAAPSNLNATATSSSQINMTWTDNSTNETGFTIERSASASGPWTAVGTTLVNGASFNNTGLAPSTTYYYRVKATNAGGSSGYSNTDPATTLAGSSVPAAPTGLSAAAFSTTQINLNWTDNATNETGFTVERALAATGPWTAVANLGTNATSYANPGLSANTTYYFRVKATNATGSSTWSNTASATTPPGTSPNPPAAPTGLAATAVSSVQINLTWTDNSNNELYFKIERATSASGPFTQLTTSTVASFSDGTLSPGTTYYYRVRAFNTGGDSAFTNVANATTLGTIPATPSGLTAVATSSTRINLSWTDNSTNETGFKIERGTTATGPFTQIATATGVSYADTGVTESKTYYYRIRAYNGSGDSGYSNTANATTPGSIPSAPTGLTAAAVGSGQINLAWTDTASNETGFKIERSNTQNGTYTQIGTSTVPSYSDTTVQEARSYYYRVRAYNASGDSAYSNVASATTTATVPAAPSTLGATGVSSSQINLSWTDNSINELGFKIERATSASGPFSQIATSSASSYSDTPLSSSTTYYYRVRAYNGAGDSGYTNTASATTQGSIPAAPSALSATAVSPSQINLTWSDNSTNEGGFKVERATSAAGPFSQIATTTTPSYNNTGLAASTTYYYRVRAYNGSGDSAYSNTASAATQSVSGPPAAPSGLSATAASASGINLAWTDNSNNETGFKVERGSSSSGPWSQIAVTGAAVTGYSDSGLAASTTYYYRVRSTNASGDSTYSNTASATTTSSGGGSGGGHMWSKRFGDSSAVTEPQSVDVDPSGNVAAAGNFFGTMDFGSGVSITSGGGYDGFVVKYNSSGTPLWAKKIGGNLTDYAYGVATDGSGNVIVVGEFQGTADLGCGSMSNPVGNNMNIFIVKYASSNGACVWSKNFGNTYRDTANAVTVDGSNNIIVTGHFWGTVDFGGVSRTSHFSLNYDPDAFLLKLAPSGTTTFAVGGFGGSSFDTGRAVAVDSLGDIYMTGEFDLSIDFGLPTSSLTCVGFRDAYVAKFSSSGAPLWAKNFGDGSEQRGTSVAVDGSNNVILAGWFRGGINFGAPSALTVPAGASSIYLAKLNSQGTYIWQKAIQDSDEPRYPAIAIDSGNNIVLACNVKLAANYGGGALTTPNTNLRDWVVAKYDSTGAHKWSDRFTGTNESWGRDIAVDGQNPVSTGYISGTVNFGGGPLSNGSGATHAGVVLELAP